MQRDLSSGEPTETLEQFDRNNVAVAEDLEDLEGMVTSAGEPSGGQQTAGVE